VLIHELAHAGMIGLLGFGSSDVVLTGMGGVTINRRRAKPWQDLLISLAGPFSSFALAGIVYLIIRNTAIARQDPMLSALMPLLLGANLFWGVFNLIPIAPLDGGHAVREFLRMFLRDRTAFVIAVWIGIVVGTAVAVIAVFTRQFFLALYLAWFVWNAVQSWQHFRRYGTPGD
jgi:Zn-dependent protease